MNGPKGVVLRIKRPSKSIRTCGWDINKKAEDKRTDYEDKTLEPLRYSKGCTG